MIITPLSFSFKEDINNCCLFKQQAQYSQNTNHFQLAYHPLNDFYGEQVDILRLKTRALKEKSYKLRDGFGL